ncbi:MAG TPA: ATP-binding protein [Thermoanaerobaculia bacterium]|nr:ATP-binding protein [Thermoanaerobaculia bacterium]
MSNLASVPAIPANCPQCNGTGWVTVSSDANRAVACGCQGTLRRQQRMVAAHIPKRYEHCTLQSFRDKSEPALRVAKQRVEAFIDLWPNTDDQRGLLLVGGCGTGKTHLAVATLSEIIRCNKPGRLLFSNFQDLIQEIQASFDPDSPVSKSDLLRPLLEADLLVLDELGSQKPTQFVQDILYYIINTRYNERLATIFTTNYFDTPADAKEESLTLRIGTRLRSRLYEMTTMVEFTGARDHRLYRRNVL